VPLFELTGTGPKHPVDRAKSKKTGENENQSHVSPRGLRANKGKRENAHASQNPKHSIYFSDIA
jgi:hypothetical protein